MGKRPKASVPERTQAERPRIGKDLQSTLGSPNRHRVGDWPVRDLTLKEPPRRRLRWKMSKTWAVVKRDS
jgi:hypothetical protein